MGLTAYFRERNEGERRMQKAVTDVALDKKLEQFVRETAQNSADAALDGETPELIYRYEKIENNLDEFLDAIDWPQLKPHLEAVAEDDDEIGVQRMLDRVERGTLPVLIVEDRNTAGLTGDEFSQDTRYSALIQDFGESTKEGDEGGIHGVGASVLWGFSGFKTALFLTNPVGWDNEAPRLVGRVDLPYHEEGGEEYQGDGWLGVSTSSDRRIESVWGDDAEMIATDELGLPAADERLKSTGTTAVVVGFREPSRSRRSPAKVIDRIEELVAKYYWPLIVEDGLSVSVQPPGEEPREVDPYDIDWLTPYIDSYERRLEADAELDEPPDVATDTISIEMPHDEKGEDVTEGKVSVVVRVPDRDHGKHTNKVAMFRGARHVVRYRQYGHTARAAGQQFHGLLVAGRARYPADVAEDAVDDSDATVEKFFRLAEPEAHNSWEEEVSKLENAFPGGHDEIKELLQDKVDNAIGTLLTDVGSSETQSLRSAGSKFPYFTGGRSTSPSTSTPSPSGDSVVESVTKRLGHDGGRIEFTGTIELAGPPEESWTIEADKIDLVDMGGRKLDTVSVESVSAETPDGTTFSGDQEVTVPETTESVEYSIRSESTTNVPSSQRGMSRLKISIDAELEGSS